MNKNQTCIHCDNPVRSRGLCESHYQQFARAKRQLAKKQQEVFDSEAVASGKIKPKDENPFAELAMQVASRNETYKADDAQAEKVKAELASVRKRAKASGNDNAPAGVVVPQSDDSSRTVKRKIAPTNKNTTRNKVDN
jgi:small-conductance mechanosensitive channel